MAYELGEEYLRANGFAGVDTSIDPRDEMLAFHLAIAGDEARARLDYLRSAHDGFVLLEHVARRAGRPLRECSAVLDFACGHGRLSRLLVHRLGPERVWASDIDAGAVAWIARTFGAHGFVSVAAPAALQPPRPFDLVYIGSLFSHLPRATFAPWLAALRRALAPDGVLVFTTHGEQLCPGPVDPSGFTFVPRSETARLAGEEYGTTWVRPELVADLARDAGFGGVAWLERDWNTFQDVFVAAPCLRGLEPWPSTPKPNGRITRAWFPAPGHAWVGGFVSAPVTFGEIREVRLSIGGRDVGDARLGAVEAFPPDGPPRRTPHVARQWYLEGDASWLTPGHHVVAASVRSTSGARACFDVTHLVAPAR